MLPIALALAQFAPSIMRFFGAGEQSVSVAEQIVGIAQTVTGAKSPEEALAAMRENAQMAQQFNLAVLAADTELEKAYLTDRQDARKRDTAFINSGRYNVRADMLAFLAVAGLVVCVWFIARDTDMPERVVNAIMFVAGVLASAVRDVYGFEFGSSRSSRDKDDTIKSLSGKPF